MLQSLDLQPTSRVLVLGNESGIATLAAAKIVGRVSRSCGHGDPFVQIASGSLCFCLFFMALTRRQLLEMPTAFLSISHSY